MRVLFDTNIILDFLFDRMPFANKTSHSEIVGFICATTVTTIFYLS